MKMLGNDQLLQVTPHKSLRVQNLAAEWIEVPPVPGTFVVNIGRCASFQIGLDRRPPRRLPPCALPHTDGVRSPRIRDSRSSTRHLPPCSVPSWRRWTPIFSPVLPIQQDGHKPGRSRPGMCVCLSPFFHVVIILNNRCPSNSTSPYSEVERKQRPCRHYRLCVVLGFTQTIF